MLQHSFWCRFFSPLVIVFAFNALQAQEKSAEKTEKPAAKATSKPADLPGSTEGLVRVSPKNDIWIDQKQKVVLVDGAVVLREGLLEMFACPKGTKEHESIVAVNCKVQFVHAALVAL